MSTEKITAKRSDVFWVKPDAIQIEQGFNVRVDYGDIEALSNSIIENGVKMPLRAYKKRGEEKLILTDGHRRFKAIQMAYEKGHTEILIPVIKEGQAPSDEDRVIGLIVYNDGKRLSPIEECEVFKRLINYGWTHSQIASRIGRSVTHVAETLRLTEVSTTMRNLIIDGKISASAVIERLRKKDAASVESEVKTAITENGGAKVTAKHLPKLKDKTGKTAFEKIKTEIDALDLHLFESADGYLVSYKDVLDIVKKHLKA